MFRRSVRAPLADQAAHRAGERGPTGVRTMCASSVEDVADHIGRSRPAGLSGRGANMTRRQRLRRRMHIVVWRIVNPPTRPLAGIAPWWVLLETTGRRTGRLHRVPLAAGVADEQGMWLNAVHGRHAAWVVNVETNPTVRMRVRRVWRAGVASVHPVDPRLARRFNFYARGGPATMGLDPLHVRIDWTDEPSTK